MDVVLNIPRPNIGVLLRGEPQELSQWVQVWSAERWGVCLITILFGAGAYGAAMGFWRDATQALFVAIKFPVIILLTTLANGLLNAMLAPLLGLNIGLRQTLLAVLMSFTIAAAILGAFSPLAAFVIWNAPSLASIGRDWVGVYSFIQVMHVGVIAFAGLTANLRLLQMLRQMSGSRAVARRVMFAWVTGNLFFGSQLSWILRPFIGSPSLAVEFLRKEALHGNFYESVFRSLMHLLH